MKKSMGRVVLIVALIMGVFMATNAFAEVIDGTIADITNSPNSITIDGTVISGIRFNYLANQYNIELETGDEVYVEYFEYTCADGTIKNMATSITIGDATIKLR